MLFRSEPRQPVPRWDPKAYAERVDAVRRICEQEGRDPATLRLSVGLYTLIGEDDRDLATRFEAMQRWMPGGALDGQSLVEFSDGALVGTPERIRERVADFEDLGVEEIIVSPAALPFASFDPSMIELFGETVARSVTR